MIGEFNRLMKEYNAEGIHDATGLGGVVADYIDRRARGFLMTGAQRDNMLSEYVSSIENHRWLAPRVPVFYKNHLYASVDMLYARGKEFHLPDEICSMALCYRLVSKRAMPATRSRSRRRRSDLHRGGDEAQQGLREETRKLGGGLGAEQEPAGLGGLGPYGVSVTQDEYLAELDRIDESLCARSISADEAFVQRIYAVMARHASEVTEAGDWRHG